MRAVYAVTRATATTAAPGARWPDRRGACWPGWRGKTGPATASRSGRPGRGESPGEGAAPRRPRGGGGGRLRLRGRAGAAGGIVGHRQRADRTGQVGEVEPSERPDLARAGVLDDRRQRLPRVLDAAGVERLGRPVEGVQVRRGEVDRAAVGAA